MQPVLDGSPSWSPDGRSIAFTRSSYYLSKQPAIYTIGVDGKGLRRVLTRAAIAVDWSPGGRSLALSWSPNGHLLAVAGGDFTGDFGIAIVTPKGKLVPRIQVGGPASGVTWSPDGRKLAYGRGGISVVATDGTGARRIAGEACGSPDWAR